jgi:type I restriction enzyme, S subunit
MSDWKETKLENLAEVQTGPFGSQLKNEQYITGGIPVVTVEHIKDFLIEDFSYPSVTDEDKNRLKKYTLKSGDIVFSRVGSVDLSALVKKHQDGWLFSSRMLRVRVKEKLDTQFLSYYLRQSAIRQFIINISVGSTMPSINTEILKSIPIAYCSLEEQKRIANILSCLDAKIENLRRQNETLEQIARSLFKHWFIDFEFPNVIGKPYKSSGGAMFTSELGEIPEGWRIFSLDEIADFLNGLAMQKYPPDNESDFLPVIKIRELRAGITDNTDKASMNIPAKYIIENGDIIFSWSGSLDVVIWNFGKGALNQHLFKVNSDKYSKWFYYYWTLTHLNDFQRIAKSKATTMGHIQRKHLTEALCNVPDSNFLEQANKIFSPILQKNINNAIHIQTLTKTRDALLPKLMSGQIRVRE